MAVPGLLTHRFKAQETLSRWQKDRFVGVREKGMALSCGQPAADVKWPERGPLLPEGAPGRQMGSG